jgi:hypothetical protein
MRKTRSQNESADTGCLVPHTHSNTTDLLIFHLSLYFLFSCTPDKKHYKPNDHDQTQQSRFQQPRYNQSQQHILPHHPTNPRSKPPPPHPIDPQPHPARRRNNPRNHHARHPPQTPLPPPAHGTPSRQRLVLSNQLGWFTALMLLCLRGILPSLIAGATLNPRRSPKKRYRISNPTSTSTN